MKKLKDYVRFDLLGMVDTIPSCRDVSIERYIYYFENASDKLKNKIISMSKFYPAWDILSQLLNFTAWSDTDSKVLIDVTKRFMNDVRRSLLNGTKT